MAQERLRSDEYEYPEDHWAHNRGFEAGAWEPLRWRAGVMGMLVALEAQLGPEVTSGQKPITPQLIEEYDSPATIAYAKDLAAAWAEEFDEPPRHNIEPSQKAIGSVTLEAPDFSGISDSPLESA